MGARGFYATIADNFFRIQGAIWKVSSCEIPLSASVSAPASRDAMTCVVLPFEQPYCSADETRLYTIRCVMNCSAYDSNYRPMMRKNTTFFKMSPSVRSLPERTW